MDTNVNASKKFNVDFNTLIILYRHYKDYFLPVLVILGSFIVLLLIVIPQMQQYFNTKQQLAIEAQKLQILKNNYNFLSNLDEAQANSQLSSLTSALPSGKDFAGVINAISASSANTGIAVGDYDFQVGELSKNEGGILAFPSLQVTVNLTGNPLALATFMSQLYKTVPVAEVTSIKANQAASVLTLLFYYKPFSNVNVNNEAPISPLSLKEQALLNDISAWQSNSFIPSLISSPASPSSGTSSSPF